MLPDHLLSGRVRVYNKKTRSIFVKVDWLKHRYSSVLINALSVCVARVPGTFALEAHKRLAAPYGAFRHMATSASSARRPHQVPSPHMTHYGIPVMGHEAPL